MNPALSIVAVLVALAVVATATGFAFGRLFRVPLLRRVTPETLAVSAFLGTGLWALAFGWGSYWGLPAPQAGRIALAVCGTFVLAALLRRESQPAPRMAGGAALGCALVLHAVLFLLPILIGGSAQSFNNDIAHYVATAQWLQNSGIGTPCIPLIEQPSTVQVFMLQSIHHRMGSIFLNALLAAALPGMPVHEHFHAAMTWGACLNVAGLYVLFRWALRLPLGFSAAATFLAAGTMGPLVFSAGAGFFSQVYGTAGLAFGLAILGRLVAPANLRAGNAVLLGLVIAIEMSMYSEMSPFVGLSALACCTALALRKWGPNKFLRLGTFALVTLLAVVLAANVEVLRAIKAVQTMMNLASGSHVDWGLNRFWFFALGARPTSPIDYGPMKWILNWPVGVLLSLACLAGAARACRDIRLLPLLTTAVVLAVLFLGYRFLSANPYTGGTGQTWNQFKLTKWSFPVIAGLQALGAYRLLRQSPEWMRPARFACVVVVLASIPLFVRWAEASGRQMREFAGDPQPFEAARRLQARFAELSPSAIYFIKDPAEGSRTRFLCCLLRPHPFANRVLPEQHALMVPGARSLESLPADTTFIVLGEPPFEEPLERLPYISIVDGTKPLIFEVAGKSVRRSGKEVTWRDRSRLTLRLFSPAASPACLSFVLDASAESGPFTLQLTGDDGVPITAIEIEPGVRQVSLPLTQSRGETTVHVRRGPPARGDAPGNGVPEVVVRDARLDAVRPAGQE